MIRKIKELLERAERLQRLAHDQGDFHGKRFYGGQVLAYRECLKLLEQPA